MPQKRWVKPCKLCEKNGLHKKIPCMFCGWKEVRKLIKNMTNAELAELNGRRNRMQFLHDLDRGSTRGANCSLGADMIDWSIEDHREVALDIYNRIEGGESYKDVAKDLEMTVKLIVGIYRLVLGKMVRGDFSIEVKPQLHIVPPPPERLTLPAGVRRHVSWTEAPLEQEAWEKL